MTIISFLSDFGLTDSYVAETKAAILRIAPGATIIDVSHDVPPGDIAAASYLLGRTWRRFPAGTVHLAVVDPGVGSERRALAVHAGGHSFVGPDNGLLTPVLDDSAVVVVLAVPTDAAPTFHGRDVFAPAAARLASGELLERLGTRISDPHRAPRPAPRVRGGEVSGVVVYIDRFGTLVTNIPSEALTGATSFTVAGGHDATIGRTFSDVAMGALVAYAGSAGTVEVAARNRSAAQQTGAGIGAVVKLVT